MVGGDVRQLARLCGEAYEFGVQDSEAAVSHLLRGLCNWIGARNAFWVASTRLRTLDPGRDPLRAWRPRRQLYAHPDAATRARTARWYSEAPNRGFDATTRQLAATAGRDRSLHLLSVQPERCDRDRWDYYNEVLRPSGIVDRVYAGVVIAPGAEAFLALDRGARDRPFREAEEARLLAAAQAARALLRRSLLACGLIGADSPFTRREREVFRHLLGGETEDEIARRLSLSLHTLHQYVVAITSKLGVRGRKGLMALALHGGQGSLSSPVSTPDPTVPGNDGGSARR